MPGDARSGSALLFVAGAAAAGLLVGGRLVKTYDWRTEWYVSAPLPVVYRAVISREAVRRWWPVMELADDGDEDDLHEDSSVTFRVHQAPEVARIAPPFLIHCVYTDVEPEKRLREVVRGDLSGVLETLFREEGDFTRVTFNWYVRVTNPVLNLLGYLAEGVYRRSHDHVMQAGEAGLRRYCEETGR